MFSSSAAEHRPWTSPLHRAPPPPRASGGRTSQLIKLRVPVLDWQLHFSGVNESPRARHATVVSVSPSKPVAPLSLQDDENGSQLRSRAFAPCDVHETIRLGCFVNGRFEQPAGK